MHHVRHLSPYGVCDTPHRTWSCEAHERTWFIHERHHHKPHPHRTTVNTLKQGLSAVLHMRHLTLRLKLSPARAAVRCPFPRSRPHEHGHVARAIPHLKSYRYRIRRGQRSTINRPKSSRIPSVPWPQTSTPLQALLTPLMAMHARLCNRGAQQLPGRHPRRSQGRHRTQPPCASFFPRE